MDKYTIYCISEQTDKALKLGAPIKVIHKVRNDGITEEVKFVNPTTEQMIGWLEEQISFIDVIRQENDTWLYIVYPETHSNKNITVKDFSSRKEATLAAIDAALEYLSNNK